MNTDILVDNQRNQRNLRENSFCQSNGIISVSICEICGTPSVKIMEKLQKIMAVAVVLFGVTLITVSFLIPPAGVIDPTVLTAFGETLTFAGALLGIDAHYKSKK